MKDLRTKAKHRNYIWTAVFCCLVCLTGIAQQRKTPDNTRPNIILILSDDMGYSDVGCFGSEINTPNIDALARGGIRYTQFYNMARCCPTRASLLTGLYPHQAGLGWMTFVDQNLPGYRGELNNSCVTIAEALRGSGYATYMTGKWHVVRDPRKDPASHNWPLQRGFEKYYGILIGASNYFDPGGLCRDNTFISPFNDPEYRPANYYFTDAVSDNTVQYIRKRDKQKPFFMYVAYTAAHWPMQAPEAAIRKYKGSYDKGWEETRKNRLEKMKKLGLIAPEVGLPEWEGGSWKDEKNKQAVARRMETYAAMVETMDQGIGRIVKALKDEGIYENTVIFYLQDNGACAELTGLGEDRPVSGKPDTLVPLKPAEIERTNRPHITRDGRIVMQGSGVMSGPADTYVAYGSEWAQVSNTPLRRYKHWVHEGGIATPLIVQWRNGIKDHGGFRQQTGHVIDIMPTILELAGAKYPGVYRNHTITPAEGVSLVPSFAGKQLPQRAIYWEHEMNRAVRMGKWKLVSAGELSDRENSTWKQYSTGPWELYDIEKDRNESFNVAAEHPDLVREMSKMWNEYAVTKNVFPAPWSEKETAASTTYYINSRTGDDNNKGISKDAPWKTLVNIGKQTFLPGDSILFAKGSSYTGGFTLNSSGAPGKPIVLSTYSVGAETILTTPREALSGIFVQYGAGRAPAFSNPDWNQLNGNVIRIEGSHVVVDGLYFHDNTNPPGSNRQNKNVQKLGAVYLGLRADHNIIRNCEFSNSPVGVKIKGKHNLVTRNYFHDTYDSMAHSWGPIAIMIVSPYNEISYNKIMNYGSYGGPYGSDGGVIELDGVDDSFDGRNILIHHNTSINNHGFVELAGRNVDSVIIAYNLSDDRNQFLGGGSMKNVFVYNNTIIRTREPNVDRYVFWTFVPEATFVTVRNNIFVLAPDMKVFGPFKKPEGHQRTGIGEQVHDHNIYFSPDNPNLDIIGIAPGKGDLIADPLFIDYKNGNYRLQKNSPARNAGAGMKLFTSDLDGYPVPRDGRPDIGAYEY